MLRDLDAVAAGRAPTNSQLPGPAAVQPHGTPPTPAGSHTRAVPQWPSAMHQGAHLPISPQWHTVVQRSSAMTIGNILHGVPVNAKKISRLRVCGKVRTTSYEPVKAPGDSMSDQEPAGAVRSKYEQSGARRSNREPERATRSQTSGTIWSHQAPVMLFLFG